MPARLLRAARLDFALKTVLSRPATSKEQRILSGVLADVQNAYAANSKAAESITAFGESKRPAGLHAVELAAWTGVANVILNLDETVTRE